jgi:Domain of unknown function (DUF1839)
VFIRPAWESGRAVTPLEQVAPDSYQPHRLHGNGADWAETNCYIDLWVGLLNGLKLEPLACLAFTVCADFEGDQWTFFKPPHADLRDLYGLQVEELSLWQPVLTHCVDHVRAGHIPLLEADSFYLPDTRATDYRQNHVKTTIAPVFIDPERRVMRYFHNATFAELSGEDFEGLFRFEAKHGSSADATSGRAHWLPPYCEIVKCARIQALPSNELAARSLQLLRGHLAWRPASNPFEQLRLAWDAHLGLLLASDLEVYHGYTFSMLRQCGACYSMLGAYLRWLGEHVRPEFAEAAGPFDAISQTCKAMLMKLARVVHSKKPRDFSEQILEMGQHWEQGMARIVQAVDAPSLS